MSVFKMPSLGADMESGELIEWLVKPGDTVAKGDVIAVVETHKGAIEIEIFEAGVVESLDVQVGESVPVGTPMAVIRAAGEAVVENEKDGPVGETVASEKQGIKKQGDQIEKVEARQVEKQKSQKQPQKITAARAAADGQQLASPAARVRAADAGADLADIPGTGPGGAVLLNDVEHWLSLAEKPAAQPDANAEAAETRQSSSLKPGLYMAMMRQAIAAAMSRAKREIPHYYLSHRIDLQAATDWLAARNAERDPEQRLLMAAMFVRATVLAVRKVPELNGTFEDGVFSGADTVNCGLAISMRGGGLIAPALMDAGSKNLDDLMLAMRDAVVRTRTGRLRNSEVTQGTITVSSMGDNGTDSLLGVIYPPQVALVGFGTPARRPWVIEDEVQVRTVVDVTLAADHRVSDGRRGARLLTEIERLLGEPDLL
ncbi:dihydrolipoamide acetyltransferase family protein [Pseudohongiella spirulinae]|uniref:Dihydrolipoamide acetyltransferase component of pyruvate dehydrogenase complex n=1 Tax=Pseudohongiella spirulinae TaxID=1249552 RepID=A0A0S2KC73_9GAMM|nr:dihydrolipoamide acetyltransferase family protein [Pseudohongiella spirulinae]ALO45937.1 Branched-chain alpha-keto acid dehydrogenase subunit E2 [Pseudohongiella spirulinae]